MKKVLSISLVTLTALTFTACASSSSTSTPKMVSKLDVKEVCSVEKNGVKSVIDTASKYNTIAKQEGLEFMRLGMKTSQYIDAVNMALKDGSKKIDIVNKKKKKTGEVSVEYGAWRACSFAIRALQQDEEAQGTWRLTVPGDGYKY